MKRRSLMIFGVLSFAALAWVVPKYFFKVQSKEEFGQNMHRSIFATVHALKSAEIYLKDSRAFIFSRTDSNQALRLHDSILVGPKSEASLLISDEFGGGKIRLLENTIITLSRTGRKNEIPRIDIKQGEIRVIQAPQKKSSPSVLSHGAKASFVEVTPMGEEKILDASSNEPEITSIRDVFTDVIITGGQQAVVFDESLENAELGVQEKTKTLEIKITAIPDEIRESSEVPTSKEIAKVDSIKMISLESIEELLINEKPLREVVQELDDSGPIESIAELKLEPVKQVMIAPQSREPTSIIPQEPLAAINPDAFTPVFELDLSKELQATPPTYFFEFSTMHSLRSYQSTTQKVQGTDLDLGLKAEAFVFDNLKFAALAELTALNIQKPTTGAPRPMSFFAEAKYRFDQWDDFWMVGGFSYQTSFNRGDTASFSYLYSPHFGFDVLFSPGLTSSDKILIAPRGSYFLGGSYWVDVPVYYYWSHRLGVSMNYSQIEFMLEGESQNKFTTFSSGLVVKF